MKIFTFLTKDNFRVDVKASTPKAAWNKLQSIPYFADIVTPTYQVYSKKGTASIYDWRFLHTERDNEYLAS